MKIHLILAAAAVAGCVTVNGEVKTPVFIAHRGESYEAPENTLPAYRMAVDRGFGFECDVYLSKDKRVFSFHDSNLKRTTGVDLPCSEASWDETVSKIDAGAWKGAKWKGVRPALLEEILALARDGRWIYVEIKSGPEIVPYVKEIFAKQNRANPRNALFICFNQAVCKELKRLMPEYRVYWLVSARKRCGEYVDADYVLENLKATGADGVDMQYDPVNVTAELISRVKAAGYAFHVWTVDRVSDSVEAVRRGAETVTTNCARKQTGIIERGEIAAADEAERADRARWLFSDYAVPEFERGFTLDAKPSSCVLDLAVGGWFEAFVNGRAVSDAVMNPPAVAYMKKTPAFRLDVTDFVKPGWNRVQIRVAPGWFGQRVEDAWGFQHAPWLMAPCVKAKVIADGATVLRTGADWWQTKSPVTMSQLRNGEFYDARLEEKPEHKQAFVAEYPPKGEVAYVAAADPVRAKEAFEPVAGRTTAVSNGVTRYDFGVNLAGWCEIEVEGEAGAKVAIDYDEKVNAKTGMPDGAIRSLVKSGRCQHDEYTLAGRKDGEKWHPRFCYHGFRYAWVTVTGAARVKAVRARVVRSDFPEAGALETDNAAYAALQAATRRSYVSNFVGIPTDCPHREKNGWTGDAQLMAETGLWNYNAVKSYKNVYRIMLDTQLANGQVSCIVPTAYQFGFGWGTGPSWDAFLFELPYQLHRFLGDDELIREGYPAMVKYLAFLDSTVRSDGTVGWGLGDWCAADEERLADRDLIVTAVAVGLYDRAAYFADHLGKSADAAKWRRAAGLMRVAWRARFWAGNGIAGSGYSTEQALALAFDLAPADERAACAKALVERVRANRHRVDFGLIGGKYVPKALADGGYADDAFELFVQGEDPGWQTMLKTGDNSLWEDFQGRWSHNHIMYGYPSAWGYEFAAGIKILEPGFKRVKIAPAYLKRCNRFAATHETPYGRLTVRWTRNADGSVALDVDAPAGITVEK